MNKLVAGVMGDEIVLSEEEINGVIWKRALKKEFEWKDKEGYNRIMNKGTHCRRVINLIRKTRRKGNSNNYFRREKLQTMKVIEGWTLVCKKCDVIMWKNIDPSLALYCSPHPDNKNYCHDCWEKIKHEQS